MTHFVH